MREAAAITLPGGLWADGQCRRSAELRPLTGEDEAFLAAADGAVSPAALATALLTRCLRVLAGGEVDADAVRGLTVGDREAVLLHLRRLSFGERLDCVLECPACGAAFDLELSVVELLQPPNGHRRERYEETIDGHAVRFRLPTGDDLEAAATPGAEASRSCCFTAASKS